MEEKAQPKISLPEIILIGLFLGILDAIDLIPFAGDLTDVFAAPLVFYYFIKNINGVAYIVSLILDAIPLTQEIPTRSIVWWGTVILDHFAPKKLTAALEQVGEIEEGGAGVEGAEEEIEKAQQLEQAGEAGEAAQNVEQAEAVEGKPSEEKQEDRNSQNTDGDEAEGGEKKYKDELESGAEIDPEEEAEGQDFQAPNPSYGEDDDEEEEDETPDDMDIKRAA
jgi:hypothetical protein